MIPGSYEQYGRIKEPRRRQSNNNTTRQKASYYYDSFNNQAVTIILINGQKLSGVLQTSIMNKYDLLLTVQSESVLIPKHAVLCIRKVSE